MPVYHFQTREFGISDEGIHLLRNGFNYKTYNFSDIDRLRIERGKEIKNWIAVLIIGIGLIFFSIWFLSGAPAILSSIERGTNARYIRVLVIAVLPLMVGGYCIYNALKTGPILKIITKDNGTDFFPLAHIEKSGQLNVFENFLNTHQKV